MSKELNIIMQILIQAICGFFSPFLLADDIGLIIMGTIFLVLTCKKKSTKSCPLDLQLFLYGLLDLVAKDLE